MLYYHQIVKLPFSVPFKFYNSATDQRCFKLLQGFYVYSVL